MTDESAQPARYAAEHRAFGEVWSGWVVVDSESGVILAAWPDQSTQPAEELIRKEAALWNEQERSRPVGRGLDVQVHVAADRVSPTGSLRR